MLDQCRQDSFPWFWIIKLLVVGVSNPKHKYHVNVLTYPKRTNLLLTSYKTVKEK